MAIQEDNTILLRFEVLDLNAQEPLDLSHLYFVFEVTNVANNCVVHHFFVCSSLMMLELPAIVTKTSISPATE